MDQVWESTKKSLKKVHVTIDRISVNTIGGTLGWNGPVSREQTGLQEERESKVKRKECKSLSLLL